MVCTNCGTQMADGTAFCPNCGAAQAAPQAPVQPAYGYQPAPQAAAQPAKGLAIASMVMGIISFFLFPVVAGPLGVIFGGVAKSKGNRSGMATAGIVCGIIGFAAWLIMVIALQNAANFLMSF